MNGTHREHSDNNNQEWIGVLFPIVFNDRYTM